MGYNGTGLYHAAAIDKIGRIEHHSDVERNLFFTIPEIDPIKTPFSSDICIQILKCSVEDLESVANHYLKAGVIQPFHACSPDLKIYSYWDILLFGLTKYLVQMGFIFHSAQSIATLLVDEISSIYNCCGPYVEVDPDLIGDAFAETSNDTSEVVDQSSIALHTSEILYFLKNLSSSCEKIKDPLVQRF